MLGDTINVNGLELIELIENDLYKYLGCDEDVGYKGNLNKESVKKEYLNCIRKIWKSELYSRNKVMAHNILAVPVFTLHFGILEWTKEKVHNIDTRTHKILTCMGNYHKNSSVYRLYTKREVGGRGLNSIFDVKSASESNKYIILVIQHEKTWVDKNRHGFTTTHQKQTCDYNEQLTHSWLKCPDTISHTESFICAIQEQEIRTRALITKREYGDNPTYDRKCRYCHNHTEDIFHPPLVFV